VTFALALAHLGRLAEASAVADEEIALARASGSPTALARALHARTVSEPNPGRRAGIAATALTVFRGPAVLVQAALQIELGAALVRLGRRVDARDGLRRALATADAAGAVPLAQRARRELVASGARPRRAALEGAAALTPRQRQVCELALAGKSNRAIAHALFLSVKTVETHLSRAYGTLGVLDRAGMIAALAR
jgi:DNA-binding NarL/FixJ family response regulator